MKSRHIQLQAVKIVKKVVKMTACVALLTSCDKLNSSPEKVEEVKRYNEIYQLQQAQIQRTLTRGIYQTEFELDPHFVRNNEQAAPLRDLLEGLVKFNVKGEIQPAVAQSWFTEDHQTWLFILNHKIWSNGEPITAEDFVTSWQRLAAPASQSPLSSYLTYLGIKHAKDVLSGNKPVSELGIEALNPSTLKITLEKANSQLPKMLGHIALLPTFRGEKPQGKFVTNGDYQFSDRQEQQLQLVARDETLFFQRVKYVLLRNVVDTSVDFIENPTASHVQDIVYLPRLCTYFYEFNFQDPQLQKPEIRRALKAMIFPARIKGENGLLNHSVLPKTMRAEVENRWSPVVVEQLLTQMGINLNNPLRLNVVYDTQGQHPQIAKQMMRALAQSDLIRVEPQEVDWNTLLNHHAQKNYQLIRSGWCADYADPAAFLWKFHSQSPDNKNSYHNAEVDSALEKLQKNTLSEKEREDLIQYIAQQLENDIAILPLFQYQRKIMIKPDLTGIDLRNTSEVIYSKDLSRVTSQSSN